MRARDNPFRVQRVDRVAYRLPDGVEALLERFATLGRRAAVLGAHGSGKTALLAALSPALARHGWQVAPLRLCAGTRRLGEVGERWLAGATPEVMLVLDGIDELAPWERWRVLRGSRAAAGLLVATHHQGRLPVLHHCRPDPALLADLVAELHAGCPCTLPPIEQLFSRFRGNLRLALRHLYDLHT